MLTMLKSLILLSCTFYVNGLTCPPSCEPPATQSGCKVYASNAGCSQDVRDISSSEAHCGCLWQTYIQTVEPQAKVIFTDEGNKCYTWAAKLCLILENNEKSLLKQNYSPKRKPELKGFRDGKDLKDILRRIQRLESVQIVGGHRKEKAKHRRRNGVGTLSKELEDLLNKEKQDINNAHQESLNQKGKGKELNKIAGNLKEMHTNFNKMHRNVNKVSGEFIGKPGQAGGAAWVEVIPERRVEKPPTILPVTLRKPTVKTAAAPVKTIYTVRPHWMDVDMPVDQFKLSVFMIILLLNILVVVVLILCRDSGSNKKDTERVKPAGDLDESNYLPDSLDGKSKEEEELKRMKSPISVFLDSCRSKILKGKKKKSDTTQFLQMMEDNPNEYPENENAYSEVREASPFIDAGMYQSSKKITRGLYENIDEEPEAFLDSTYEEPLPALTSHSDTREYHNRKSSLRSESVSEDGSSSAKYYPRDLDTSTKSVSFSLSPGTYLTLQDRVDGSTHIETQEKP